MNDGRSNWATAAASKFTIKALCQASSRAVRPGDDFLCGSLSACAGSETDKTCISSHGTRDINGPGIRERGIGHGVCDGHGERRAIVGHVHLEDVAAVKVYPAAERNRRASGRRAIGIQPCGVDALLRILEQVEFHRDAGGNSRRSAGCAWSIAESPT